MVDETDLRRFVVAVGTALVYGPAHELGATIRARRAPFLVWRDPGTGAFVRARQVAIPRRPYLNPALEKERPGFDGLLVRTYERHVGTGRLR